MSADIHAQKILILDFGSQYTQLIGRRVRELNVYCEIHPFNHHPEIDESVKEFLLSRGYDVAYGARPMKRTIQKHLINALSTELLMNTYSAGDNIVVRYPGGAKLEFGKN